MPLPNHASNKGSDQVLFSQDHNNFNDPAVRARTAEEAKRLKAAQAKIDETNTLKSKLDDLTKANSRLNDQVRETQRDKEQLLAKIQETKDLKGLPLTTLLNGTTVRIVNMYSCQALTVAFDTYCALKKLNTDDPLQEFDLRLSNQADDQSPWMIFRAGRGDSLVFNLTVPASLARVLAKLGRNEGNLWSIKSYGLAWIFEMVGDKSGEDKAVLGLDPKSDNTPMKSTATLEDSPSQRQSWVLVPAAS